MPVPAPLTTPVPVTTEATEALLLLHVPPALASVSVTDEPVQMPLTPLMADGRSLTVTMVVVMQPVGKVYVMIVVPNATPVTTPEPATTVAIVVLSLAHVPPVEASVSDVVAPMQTLAVPVMVAGNGFTVITADVEHPVDPV